MPIPESIETDDVTVKRVERATDNEMERKGLVRVSEDPDFLIAMHTGAEDKTAYNKGWQWEYVYSDYFMTNRQRTFQYREGLLVLEFVDAESKELAWRGHAKGFLGKQDNPKKEDELVKKAVHKILKNFPPPRQTKGK
jgi:hypothetical protein